MVLNGFYQPVGVCGTVVALDAQNLVFSVQSRSKNIFETYVGPTKYYKVLTNVDGIWRDRVADPDGLVRNDDPVRFDLRKYKYIARDMTVFVRGIYQQHGNQQRFYARTVYLMHSIPGRYLFEETHWWLVQISRMADRWLDVLFDARLRYEIDGFSKIDRTNLKITGGPTADNVQACAALSRLIYGLSWEYVLTGDERYYLAAKAGVDYQREAFRSLSHDGQRCIWAFGRRRTPNGEKRQMRYPRYQAQHLPIGSGVTEAACKTLVKQRLCRSGMRWRERGASIVLSLRALVLSQGRWQQFWNKIDRYGLPVEA